MYPLRFFPFIGSNYHSTPFKILVLGESHYDEKLKISSTNPIEIKEVNNFTNYIVNKYLGYVEGKEKFEKWMNTFTKFANIFSDKSDKTEKLNSNEKIVFWQGKAFYNFIQVPMSSARVAPTLNDFALSISAFKVVCKEYAPDLIIIWGYRVWLNFPNEMKRTIDINDNVKINLLNLDGTEYPFLAIAHPSSSHLTRKHSADYMKYVKDAKDYKEVQKKM